MTRPFSFVTITLLAVALVACGSDDEGGGQAGTGGQTATGGTGGAGGSGGQAGTAGSAGDAGTGGSTGGAAGTGGGGGAAGTAGTGGMGGSAGTGGTGGSAGTGGTGGSNLWQPAPGTSWQWQLTDSIDTSVDVAMYDIDLFVPKATIDKLHQDGRVVICYFSAGSWENWRDDAGDFPSAALGNELDGWPDERWLDVTNATVRSIMQARLDFAVQQGCDGVEPDNVDGYDNDSGFGFGASDQLDYNRFIAQEAHTRGLSVGLKNDLAQVDQLVGDFDWALNEECFQWDECGDLLPFIQAGKAVFHVEYGGANLANTVCPVTEPMGFSTLIKNLDLDAWRVACN